MNALRALRWGVRRVGRSGIVGAAAALALALAAASWWLAPRLQAEAESLQVQRDSEVERLRALARTAPADGATQLTQFRQAFPPASRAVDDLRVLYRLAREHRIALPRGDYALTRQPDTQLTAFAVSLPVRASYASVRAFVAAALNELAHASLTELRLERAAGEAVEARVQLTLFYRAS